MDHKTFEMALKAGHFGLYGSYYVHLNNNCLRNEPCLLTTVLSTSHVLINLQHYAVYTSGSFNIQCKNAVLETLGG